MIQLSGCVLWHCCRTYEQYSCGTMSILQRSTFVAPQEHAVTYRILVNHKPTKSFKNVCFSICFVLLCGFLYENLQNSPPLPRPTLTLKCLGLRVCAGKGVRASGLHRCSSSSVLFPECGDHRACTPLTERKRSSYLRESNDRS
jgi:hypothetical protein